MCIKLKDGKKLDCNNARCVDSESYNSVTIPKINSIDNYDWRQAGIEEKIEILERKLSNVIDYINENL